MKILMISSYLPYPLFSGGHIRLFNLIRELSKKHKITLVCEKRDYQTEKDITEVSKFCQKVIAVPRKKQWSPTNILKTGFSPFPFLMTGHTNFPFKEVIAQELEDDSFDLIHVETFYIMQNLPAAGRLPIILAEQNIEYLVYKRFVAQANFFIKPLLYLDIIKMKYWEEKFWRKADYVIMMSNEDKKIIDRENVTVVPNGVDLESFRKLEVSRQRRASPKAGSKKLEEKTILFIGNFRWLQNRDAVRWLLKEIWPAFAQLRRGKPKLKLWVVGKEIPESIKRLTTDETVIFDEKADDTVDIFKKVDLLLAPIRVGGGTSFKILEAMASGVPVVTTSLGIEGIEAQNGRQVLIADNVEGLVDKTMTILEDQTLYKKLAQEARSLIEKKYDWKIIVKKLESVYQSVTR